MIPYVEISEALNKHFAEIGPNLASKLPNPTNSFASYIKPAKTSFFFQTVTPNKVLKILTSLSTKKANGLDNIPCRLIKEAAPIVVESLCDMFNKSIVSGTFPSEWKHAKVIPVHKGKERDDMINYRPISLISAIAKIFERLIYDQLYDYLSKLE